MDSKADRKSFRCDCEWPRHHLEIGCEGGLLSIAVVNETRSFLDKLKAIGSILRQDQYFVDEVIVNRDEVDEFASFVSEACKRVKLPTT